MKKALSFLCFLAAATLGAQEHWGLPETGTIYTCYLFNIQVTEADPPSWTQHVYSWGTPVEVDGQLWTQISECDACGNQLVRSEGSQWIMRLSEWQDFEEVLLFDWSAEVGDTLEVRSTHDEFTTEPVEVLSVEEVTIADGSMRKLFTTRLVDNENWVLYETQWLEGIGSINEGFLMPSVWQIFDAMYPQIVCVQIDGQLIYERENTSFLPSYTVCNWSPVGVEELDKAAFSVFPNPASESIEISLEASFSSDPTRIVIIDSQGKQVHQQNFRAEVSIIQVSLTDIVSGLYFVRLEQNGLPLHTKRLLLK